MGSRGWSWQSRLRPQDPEDASGSGSGTETPASGRQISPSRPSSVSSLPSSTPSLLSFFFFPLEFHFLLPEAFGAPRLSRGLHFSNARITISIVPVPFLEALACTRFA